MCFCPSVHSKGPLLWPAPFYLIINTAVGGPWPLPANGSTVTPTYHVVDYVKVSVAN